MTGNLQRVAVLGAGISGLSAAHFLRRLPSQPQITVFESSDRVGGLLKTERAEGFLIESTADSFLNNKQLPWAGRLAEEIGFRDLSAPKEEHRRALILKSGKTFSVPEGFYLMAAAQFAGIWSSPVLSWPAKIRLRMESLIPAGLLNTDVSLADFARRRVGKETYQQLVQPLVSGIYTADPERLSMEAALPQFVEMVRKHGSLIAGLRNRNDGATPQTSGARYQLFRAPNAGMGAFIQCLAKSLTNSDNPCEIRLSTPITSLTNSAGTWQIETANSQRHEFDHCVVATPAPVASRILAASQPGLAKEVGEIEHAGVAVVAIGYKNKQIQHPMEAFGLVIPDVERRDIIAISFGSNKFANRAPDDHTLLRVFLGGASRRDLLESDDAELIRIAVREAADILTIQGEPTLTRLYRWDRVTPQYHVGHLARLQRIDTIMNGVNGLAIAGNAYHGIGIPQCVRSGYQAAERIAKGFLE